MKGVNLKRTHEERQREVLAKQSNRLIGQKSQEKRPKCQKKYRQNQNKTLKFNKNLKFSKSLGFNKSLRWNKGQKLILIVQNRQQKDSKQINREK